MNRRLCAVLLAAGEGTRLRPLTAIRPKALCPVGNVALLDRAVAAVATLGLSGDRDVAVNAWHLAAQLVAHPFAARPHLSPETGAQPLGSSGGVAALRDWIDGRDVVVGNADAYLAGGTLAGLTADWTGDEVRMLGVPVDRHAVDDFGQHRFAGFTVIPWRWIESLKVEPTDLVRTVWRPAEAAGELRVVEYAGRYIDCGTPADYLTANLDDAARRGVDGSIVAPDAVVGGGTADSVIGPGAIVAGSVRRCVVWPGAIVSAGEHLVDAIRYGRDRADTIAAG
jgi:MurNAc alpha-1-phosphate uridylyltransferase